jgi:transcriptional regulator with XRE-family HTH domain
MAIHQQYIRNQRPPAEGFGHLLRHWRELRDLTLGDLARATGLDRSMISRLETGSRVPSRPTMIALADALALSGANRAMFLGSLCVLERPLTDAQASYLAGWTDSFTRR